MLFISVKDFFAKASREQMLSREQEKELYLRMKAGDMDARQQIIQSYWGLVAAVIKRQAKEMHSLHLVYKCLEALEREVDRYNFLHDGDTFAHHFGFYIKREISIYMASMT